MLPYIIAPHLVRVGLNKELHTQFVDLNKRLEWRPLTTNLESCEEAPYLYFRITLTLRPGASTYAGFATGAPFMLTRDKDVNKRAFFLRHWVRRVSPSEHKDVPQADLSHMDIGTFENYLFVRVEIDRPLVTRDTFKSIPFATYMFQVVQIDAVITELPNIRFAFAVERTVTAEEREIIAKAGHSIPAKGPKLKPQPSTASPPLPQASPYTTQFSSTLQRGARPLMRQSVQPNLHASPMQQSLVMQRPPAYVAPAAARTAQQPYQHNPYQHNPYQYASARQIQPTPAAQTNAPRVQPVAPSNIARPSQRIYARPTASAPAPPSATSDTKLLHPYLKLWEDRDPDDPYEPIFITKDDKFEAQARRSLVIEKTEEHAERLDYKNLYGLPTADYPAGFFDGPDITYGGGEADIEIVVKRHNRPQHATSQDSDRTANGDMKSREADNYSAAVAAAAEYNALLREERSELKKWLEEDAAREEKESEEEEDEEEADQDSSE